MIVYKYKVLILGPPAVGKTSLMHRFVSNDFNADYHSTIGAKFLTKDIKLNPEETEGEEAQLSLWDVGGQPRFLDLRTTFYRGANGALIVFDLVREETFEEVDTWLTEMTATLTKEIPFILIGNKSDLIRKEGRKVDIKEAQEYAKKKDSVYIETSAKTGTNVEKSFIELTRLITSRTGVETSLKKARKEAYFIRSKVKDYIESKGYQISNELMEGNVLNEIILKILRKAIKKAKADGRKTVQAKDI
jgi:Ras-related protein Rab-11A